MSKLASLVNWSLEWDMSHKPPKTTRLSGTGYGFRVLIQIRIVLVFKRSFLASVGREGYKYS